jgi:CDP-paratose 2-epimerase
MLEAIDLCEQIAGRELAWTLAGDARIGDHRWWISDLTEFQRDYPNWSIRHDLGGILREIYEARAESWLIQVPVDSGGYRGLMTGSATPARSR